MSGATRAAPIDEAERAGVLDALRGFALLGILISHVPGFTGYEFLPSAEQARLDGFGIGPFIGDTITLVIDGKFVSLFSLLFGIGFALQLASARRRGARFARHFARRLAVLFAIGVVHGLLWYGDILRDYAWLGLLLIPTATWTARATGLAAAAVLVARVLWPLLVLAVVSQVAPPGAGSGVDDPRASFFERSRAFAGDDSSALFLANLELLRIKALQLFYEGRTLSILGMFLLGAAIGKLGLHDDLERSRILLRRVLAVCAPIGLAGNLFLVSWKATTPDFPPTPAWVAVQVLVAVAVPALTLAYASSFALLWRGTARAVLRVFEAPGRMALTTYVSQTLICVVVFYGVGLGFHGRVGPLGCVAAAFALFALQCAASAAWLRRFRFGPLEWAWRRATYGVPLPMVRGRPRPLAPSTRRASW